MVARSQSGTILFRMADAVAILLLTASPALLLPVVEAAGLGARVESATDALDGLARLESAAWELVLVDADFAGGAALELVEELALAGQPVVVLAAQPTLALTIRALRAGARDVLPLPPAAERLRQLVTAAAGHVVAARASGSAAESWVGSSPAMLDAFRGAVRLAAVDLPVLICGESGTGKALIARLVHEQSARAAGPFITVNCAALPERVLESELFGHERGAIAGAYARRVGRFSKATGGTLLLDEVSHLSPRLQSKLHAVLRSGTVEALGATEAVAVDCRIIATVDGDAGALVAAGTLQEGLFYEFSGGTIMVPPLRERGRDDIRQLCSHYLREYATRYDCPVAAIGDDAWSVLERQPWPGNVRQLRGAIERAVTEADGAVIHAAHLPPELRTVPPVEDDAAGLTLAAVEQRHIARVLELTGGHLGRTAETLGVHRNTLRRKLAAYQLGADRNGGAPADISEE